MRARLRLSFPGLGLAVAAALLAPAALAQPAAEECAPGTIGNGFAISSDDLCVARVIEVETRIQALGTRLCSDPSSPATRAAEEQLARDFGAVAKDCGQAALARESVLTQSYLHAWLAGPSSGWGDDLTIHGVKVDADLRAYRETITSSWGDGLAAEKLPGWYKKEAAYAEAVGALLDAARDYLKAGSDYALSPAKTRIERFERLSGAGEDDPRRKLLNDLFARIQTPSADPVPAELLRTFAANRPIRLSGAAGFHTEACDAAAANDDALADGLALGWAMHLLGNGPKELQKLDAAVDAIKGSFNVWSRAEQAFGTELTGAAMSTYVKKTYFAGDDKVREVPPEMARELARLVNGAVRQKLGLPPAPASTEATGEAMGLAGSRFDSNANLRVVFPGKCVLDSVRHVKADGTTGEILTDHDWDRRGIYWPDSFKTDESFPISELVFRETSTTDPNKNRSYDVTLTCGDRIRKVRLSLPPRPATSDEAIDFVTRDAAPPHADIYADGKVDGLMVSGYHTRDADTVVRALKSMGFREVSRRSGVSIRDRFFEVLGQKRADGKPVIDYFIKHAHANGYAYDAGMFRANKTGDEIVLEKRTDDGKPHRITVLGNKDGEGRHGGPDGFETVDYARFFDVMAARGDSHLFVGNLSCWSDGKTAFEMDGIRNRKVKYLPTDKMAHFWPGFWYGMADGEHSFQIVRAIDERMTYAKMRETFTEFDEEILMPDDPAFVGVITEKIKSYRAGSSGIPVRVSLQETRPNG